MSKTIYQQDITIFGRLLCAWCGVDSPLYKVEVAATQVCNLCEDCIDDLPIYIDEED